MWLMTHGTISLRNRGSLTSLGSGKGFANRKSEQNIPKNYIKLTDTSHIYFISVIEDRIGRGLISCYGSLTFCETFSHIS